VQDSGQKPFFCLRHMNSSLLAVAHPWSLTALSDTVLRTVKQSAAQQVF